MGCCFILPGWAGSELRYFRDDSLIWPNRVLLALGALEYMELAEGGRTPKAPKGIVLVPGLSVDGYMDKLSSAIFKQSSYIPFTWGWDWRNDLREEGIRLAEKILNFNYLGPHAIVAHSAGGLVARFCWGWLKSKGKESLIKRIVTLGTPHRGTLAMAKAFRGQDATINSLANCRGFGSQLIRANGESLEIPLQVLSVLCSWPSTYQLFPLQDAQQQEQNPESQSLLYEGAYLGTIPVKASYLEKARTETQPALMSADNLPPYEILTTVAGRGVETQQNYYPPLISVQISSKSVTREGDGTVLVNSALLPRSSQHMVEGYHADLPSHPYVLKQIGSWLNEERAPVDTVPPAEVVKRPITVHLNAAIAPVVPIERGGVAATVESTASPAGLRSETARSDNVVSGIEQTDPVRAGVITRANGTIDPPDPPFKGPLKPRRRR